MNDECTEVAKARPREYVRECLAILGHLACAIGHVDPVLLAELAGGGALPPPGDENTRRAVVELATAARQFYDAARLAQQRGIL